VFKTQYKPSPLNASRLAAVQPLFVDGSYAAGSAGETYKIFNPSTGGVLTTATNANSQDVQITVAAARQSFDRGIWRNISPMDRARILWRIADLIDENAGDLAELEMLNAGKRLSDARDGEIPFAAECFRYYAGWCTKIEGNYVPLAGQPANEFMAVTKFEPIGVCALIVPWNGPLVQAAWKVAPALAAGCSCVLKPAEETPLTALILAELAGEAGVPAGCLNVITGRADVGRQLVGHPEVDKVSFTGSTATGKKIVGGAETNLKKVSLELGGKSPIVVFRDADIEAAAAGAAGAIFSGAGQVCVAGSRLYVEEPVYDEFIQVLKQLTAQLKVGCAADPNTDIGPLISRRHLERVDKYVQLGVQAGAVLESGGSSDLTQGGYFYQPTIFSAIEQSMQIVQEEIFGPVLVASRFEGMEEALVLANDSKYGLAASVWSRNISLANQFADGVRAGLVWINSHGLPDMAVPFGGFKQSGWGRENGFDALRQYLEVKSVITRTVE